MSLNIGKQFEKVVWENTYNCVQGFLYRNHLKDSGSAGTDKTNQAPADFLFGFRGNAYLVECKASRVEISLASCFANMVKKHQIASLYAWHLSGNYGLVLFYSELTGLVECWPSKVIIEASHEKKTLDVSQAFIFPLNDLKNKFEMCLLLA